MYFRVENVSKTTRKASVLYKNKNSFLLVDHVICWKKFPLQLAVFSFCSITSNSQLRDMQTKDLVISCKVVAQLMMMLVM